MTAGPSRPRVAPTVEATNVWLKLKVGAAMPSATAMPVRGSALGKSVMSAAQGGGRGRAVSGARGGQRELAGRRCRRGGLRSGAAGQRACGPTLQALQRRARGLRSACAREHTFAGQGCRGEAPPRHPCSLVWPVRSEEKSRVRTVTTAPSGSQLTRKELQARTQAGLAASSSSARPAAAAAAAAVRARGVGDMAARGRAPAVSEGRDAHKRVLTSCGPGRRE